MATGTISWSAPIKGLLLDKIEIAWNHPAVVKIEVKTEHETRLTVTFTVQDVFVDKDAILITRDPVEILAGRLALEFSCEIGEFHCNGWSLPTDDSGAKHIVVSEMVLMYDILEGEIKPSPERVSALLPVLQQPVGPADQYLSLFRFSLHQRDPIARFMFLYNLVLLLNRDRQRAVDESITAIDNSVPTTASPIKQGVAETIFTRLRNEIAHVRHGAVQANTAKEVAENVAWFQEIARKALLLWCNG